MKIKLSDIERMELQDLLCEMLSEQKHLEVIENFDSSALDDVCQLKHGLIKLENLVKGNKYNKDYAKLLDVTINEMAFIKGEYDIDTSILPVLIKSIIKRLEKFDYILELDEFTSRYKTNIKARYDAMVGLIKWLKGEIM